MKRVKLTDKFCRSAERVPVTGRDWFYDMLVSPLALQVTENGHRSFVLVTRYPANPKNPTRRSLGDYLPTPKGDEDGDAAPEVASLLQEGNVLTLEQARTKARIWLALIDKGIDPKVEKERQRAAALRSQRNNFEHVAEEFLRRYVKGPAYCALERLAGELQKTQPGLKPGTAMRRVMAEPANQALVLKSKKEGLVKKQAADSIIRAEFIKRWGARPVLDIQPDECAAAIREIVDRGTPEQARTAFEWLRRLFNWSVGVNEFGIVASPVAALRPTDLIGKKVAKDRILSDEELRAVWSACDLSGWPYGPTVRMLILTGQRLTEVSEAPWAEFDLDNKNWTIAGNRMKGDHGVQVVPLARDALALMKAIPRFAGGTFAFSTDGRRPVNGWSRAKERLDGFCGVKDWTLHDLRRTMRSHLSALPIEEHVREIMIGHRPVGIKKVYDRHLYEAEKRAGFESWETRLRGILAPKAPADVADLAEARAARAGA